jgi:hypothetical protein
MEQMTGGDRAVTRWAALLAAVGFLGMMGFQLLLAAGAPLGRFAWGGAFETLPPNLRIGSLISAGIFLLAAAFVLERGGLIRGLGKPRLAHAGTWFMVVLFSLSAVLNAFQGSPWEKRVMLPVAIALVILSLVVVLGPKRRFS